MIKKIKITLIVSILLSLVCFTKRSYSLDGLLMQQSNSIKSKTKELKENKTKYIWKKRGKYQIPEYEKLNYNLSWNTIPFGKASLELKGFVNVNGRKAHYAQLEFTTSSFLTSLYSIEGKIESLFDKESKSSLKFSSRIIQNEQENYEYITIDPISSTYELKSKKMMKKGYTATDVQDILTALFYIRSITLKVGTRYNLNILLEDLSYPLTIKVTRKEMIKTTTGEFNCFVIESLLNENAMVVLNSKITIYIADDKKRTPVGVKLESQLGLISALLE